MSRFSKNSWLSSMGARIKERRIAQGLSQESLAFKVGYKSRTSINKIELGKTDVPQSILINIADALNTTPAYLMGLDDDPNDYERIASEEGIYVPRDFDGDPIDYIKFKLQNQSDGLVDKYYDDWDAVKKYLEGNGCIVKDLEDDIVLVKTPDRYEIKLHEGSIVVTYQRFGTSYGVKSFLKLCQNAEIAIPALTYPIIGEVAAGFGSEAIEEETGDYEQIPVEWLRGRRQDEFFVLRVKGDSMYPNYMDGDRVLVLRTPTVESGTIAVVLYDGQSATLKKVNYVYGEDWMELEPLNREYAPKRIEAADLEQCRVLGEVKRLIRVISE